MGVSTKGATKCSQQRDLTDEVARRWSMVRSLVRVEHEVTKPQCPTNEGNALLHLKLGLQRGLCYKYLYFCPNQVIMIHRNITDII